MDNEKPFIEIHGRITGIDSDKRFLTVKSGDGIIYPLKWRDVLDLVCRKQKQGWPVKVIAVTDPADEQLYIKEIGYDDSQKKQKSAYADPTTGNEILLMNCFRTGASVLAYTTTPDTLDFDGVMDTLMERAKKDAATIKQEAKRL